MTSSTVSPLPSRWPTNVGSSAGDPLAEPANAALLAPQRLGRRDVAALGQEALVHRIGVGGGVRELLAAAAGGQAERLRPVLGTTRRGGTTMSRTLQSSMTPGTVTSSASTRASSVVEGLVRRVERPPAVRPGQPRGGALERGAQVGRCSR